LRFFLRSITFYIVEPMRVYPYQKFGSPCLQSDSFCRMTVDIILPLLFVSKFPMYKERRSAHRYTFIAPAEIEANGVVRAGCLTVLCVGGCYLAMREPFSEGALVLVKIRTNRELFQSYATVVRSVQGVGMGLEFEKISPPFQMVLIQELVHVLPP
jgi:hypothetical protein